MNEIRCCRCHGTAICVSRSFHAGGKAPSKQHGIKPLTLGTYMQWFECTNEACGHLWDTMTREADVLGGVV